MMLDAGSLVVLPVPFSDLRATKRRPALLFLYRRKTMISTSVLTGRLRACSALDPERITIAATAAARWPRPAAARRWRDGPA